MKRTLVAALAICGALLAFGGPGLGAQAPSVVPVLLVTSAAQRQAYLAHATMWRDRPALTPEDILKGPVDRYPLTGIAENASGAIPCTYVKGGAGQGGRTAKFTCRTDEGRTIRVKYYDGSIRTGNREVFSEVAATRLFWALGFDGDPMFPVTVECRNCPADPMRGVGPRATRTFPGVVEAHYQGLVIGSSPDVDQGWSFGELVGAIQSLPAGSFRAVKSMRLDALRLLAAFVQHGDRKPSQQRLVCLSALDPAAGSVQPFENEAGGFEVPVFFERPDASTPACGETGVTIQDLGATFGGGGQFTMNVGAKMHLAAWAGRRVFATRTIDAAHPGDASECRASITPSATAGEGADENPRIGEAGREFLYERLSALTPAHVRAIFQAARVLELKEPHEWRDPASGKLLTGLDAWVGAFNAKVEQIGRARCTP